MGWETLARSFVGPVQSMYGKRANQPGAAPSQANRSAISRNLGSGTVVKMTRPSKSDFADSRNS